MIALQRPDSLRAVLDSVFAAPQYRWTAGHHPFALLKQWWLQLTHWLDALDERSPLVYDPVEFALVAVLVAVMVHAGWLLLETVRSDVKPAPAAPGDGSWRDDVWYHREADRLANEGRYADAVQAEFVALVLALDRRAVVHYDPSLTPAEYLREAHLEPDAQSEFRELVRRLYGYAFARWPCTAADWTDWRAHAVPERYAAAH